MQLASFSGQVRADDTTSQTNASTGANSPSSATNNAASGVLNPANPVSAEGPATFKRMSLEQLMNQDVTTVSRSPEPLGQAPAAIVVITSDEIRRSSASSIPEALRLADNLNVAQKNSHDWAISARGFNSDLGNKMLVMIDGRTVYSPEFSGVFWNAQDYLLQDIDRIEVISGPGGTLWGANAVNGVINIITKNAQDTQGLYVEGGAGNELRGIVGARYGFELATNVYMRVYGKYAARGPEDYPDGTEANDAWYMGQGGFRLDAIPSTLDNFTFQGDIYGSSLNIPAGGIANQSGGNLLGRWSHYISDESDMSLQLYYDRTHLYLPETYAPTPSFSTTEIITEDLSTYDMDFQYRTQLGERNKVVWGAGARYWHDLVGEANILQFLPPSQYRHLYNVFVQDEIKLVDDVFLTLGTKVEHNDYTGFELEPNGRLQWNITSNHMIWGAVSRAVRMPSRFDTDVRENVPTTPPTTIISGSPNFESETLIAYELGYRAQITPKVSTSISSFFNDYTDLRSLNTSPTPLGIPLVYKNDLEGYTTGFELMANYQVLPDLRLHIGYDLLKEHIQTTVGGFDFFNALNETADPQHQFFFGFSTDLPHNIEFDGQFRWIDQLIVNNPNANGTATTVPSYCELNARLAWHATRRLEFAIVGQNLLHERHAEYGVPTAVLGGQEDIIRSVYGKVSWSW